MRGFLTFTAALLTFTVSAFADEGGQSDVPVITIPVATDADGGDGTDVSVNTESASALIDESDQFDAPGVANAAAADGGDGPDASVITNSRLAPISVPNNVGTDGAFSYSVPIKIPAFRGLEPNLSLNYNSQNKSRGGADDIIGRGWSLGGLSSIERVSVGNGAPTYVNGQDIFLLDGMELLGCKDTVNPLNMDYPDAFKTKTPNASCRAGGNMVAMRDSGLKILRTGTDLNRDTVFFVFRPDGTRLKYESVGNIAGADKGKTGDYHQVAFRRKWLLTEIRDTQAAPNIVSIEYFGGNLSTGFTPRVSRIKYGNYTVSFHYEMDSDHVLHHANGTQHMGKQIFALKSIIVASSGQKIRGYKLNHFRTKWTKTRRLTSVTEYGTDLELSTPHIVGGDHLPPWRFEYEGDPFKFALLNLETDFHTSMSVVDRNQDGRDELIFLEYKHGYPGEKGSYTLPSRLLSFNANREVISDAAHNLPALVFRTIAAFLNRSFAGWSRPDGSSDKRLMFTLKPHGQESVSTRDVDSHTKLVEIAWNHGAYYRASQPLIGNFFGDAGTEVITATGLYSIADGKVTKEVSRSDGLYRNTATPLDFWWETWAVDIDGDGYDEVVKKGRIWDFQGDKFVSYLVHGTPFASHHHGRGDVMFGDVNGDGRADAIIHDRRGTDIIGVSLSTGRRFTPSVDWSWGAGLGVYSNSKGYGGSRSTVADINGDGLADLVLHEGHGTIGDDGVRVPLHAQVFLSNGAGFVKTPHWSWFDRYYGLGDFDGNGLLDVVSHYSSGPHMGPTIAFNRSGLLSTLQTVREPDGEIIEVDYSPSSHFGVSEIPGVRQLVTKIARKNGETGQVRTMRYEYAGGKYDYGLRKSLGYGKVTAILPKTPEQNLNPRLVTEYAQDNWGMKGNVTRQRLYYGDEVWRDTVNTWSDVEGHRPFRSFKTSTVESTRWWNKLISQRIEYEYSFWGAPTVIRQYGFGGKMPNADDVVTKFGYKPNTAKYIVNKPNWKIVGNGQDVTWGDTSNWLQAEFYTYDGNATDAEAPVRGNLSRVKAWAGGATHGHRSTRAEFTYDAYGNVLTETDPLGNQTTHTYDVAKNLFRISSTNALGQKAVTSWHYRCQAPVKLTDANGLVTTISYDQFCREVRRDLP
ncbi:toxin TcdB middle/N-terminal domain-containing protein, partial [Aliiroseovarius halocynthiae]